MPDLSQLNSERVGKVICGAIQSAIDKAIDAEIENAKARIEKRVREDTALITAVVLRQFSIERFGEKLRIEVDFKNVK